MSTELVNPELGPTPEAGQISITTDICAFGNFAAWFAGTGGVFLDGPRKGQQLQARSGWCPQAKRDPVSVWDPVREDWITWSASDQVREVNGKKVMGLALMGRFNKGGYIQGWAPLESFTRATLVLDGEWVKTDADSNR